MKARLSEHPVVVFTKYALSGGIGGACELLLLHILTTKTELWYVYASALSSLLSFVIGFSLRKLWVFEDKSWKDMGQQLGLYLLTLLLVVGSNTLLMSFLVEHFDFHVLIAQFSAGIFTGLIGFIINRKFTFHYK